jgi:formylglycine-generating enzyme required for sulfatase activity
VIANGTVTFNAAQSPIGKYTEAKLPLPDNAVPLEMVAISGGTFSMGHNDESDSDYNGRHEVTIPDFFIGQYEVTQAQYEAVMGNNPSTFKGANNPVENVSWEDAKKFIDKLNAITGKNYRLPTEAEWEYATRAGTDTPFSYGETITSDVVNYDGSSYPYNNASKGEFRERTIEVNELYPNPWGLYHIHGNVWEWIQDQFQPSYKDKPSKLRKNGSAPWIVSNDTDTPAEYDPRVIRGGSWGDDSLTNRSYARNFRYRDFSEPTGGFRLVMIP